VPLRHPGLGQVEQDPEAVIVAVRELMRQVLVEQPAPELVAITGQGDGCWLLDADGRPIRPAISVGRRAAGTLRTWAADGVADAVYRVAGNALFFPGAQAARSSLAGPITSRPYSTRRGPPRIARTWLFQRNDRAAGDDASDRRCRSATAAEATPPRCCGCASSSTGRPLLAPVVSPLPIGTVRSDFGLLDGTPVVPGPFDMPACTVGVASGGSADGRSRSHHLGVPGVGRSD